MKTRSKLLLAAVSLLTVSVAATATSAYAWYTANRQVEAKVNSLGVHSTTGSLTIEHDTTIKQTKTDSKLNKTGENLVYETNSILTDVSSQGNGTFIKPKWDASGNANAANCVGVYDQDGEDPNRKVTLYGSGETPTTAYGVVSLGVKFKNDGKKGADDMYLYLDPKVTVEATGTGKMSSNSVVNSARFSICDVDSSTTAAAVSSVYLYGNPKSGTSEVNKFVSVESNKSINFDNMITSNVVDESNLFNASSKRVTDPTAEGNQAPAKGFLCKISAGEEHRYLITMWVEGTDKDCKFDNAVTTDSFEVTGLSINLGFYALTAAPTPAQNQGGSEAGAGA